MLPKNCLNGSKPPKRIALAVASIMLGLSMSACSPTEKKESTSNSAETKEESVLKNLNEKLLGVEEFKGKAKVKKVQQTDSGMFYYIEMEDGGSGYVTSNLKYIIGGPILAIDGNSVVEISESIKNQKVQDALKNVDLKAAITYTPDHEIKDSIYVLTDPSCPACQQFHKEIDKLVENGIQVHYLPWLRSPASKQIIDDVWCAKDKKTAYEKAIKSQKFNTEKCESPALEVSKLSEHMTVIGTPTIITQSGKSIAGAIPAEAVLELITPKNETPPNKQ